MTIEADIKTELDGNSTLNALVAGRNYKGRISQNAALPHTFSQRISTIPVQHLDGSSGKINARYQIDCYAATYSGAWALARAVKGAMTGATLFKARWLDDADFNYVEELECYRISSDFSVWFTE
jgi:hypothetical protein